MKNIIILALFALTITSCSSRITEEQTPVTQTPAEELAPVAQAPQNFDVVDSEAAAAEINKKTEEQIEEVQVEDRVFFEVNSSTLNADASKILENQTAWLKSDPAIKVIIEGHCDERGTREYNIALGERRADAVKQYLTGNGVEASRVKTISYGKERPAFVGGGEEIWAKNRRAVTVIEE